jgi:acyl phosphate:glycerol-3-phosphate acyltransferase
MPNMYLLWIVGYFVGSIPFGYIVGRLKHIDIRKMGSGSTGGTNVARNLGLKWGILSGILDLNKSYIFVLVVLYVYKLPLDSVFILSIAPIIGHIFPIWLGFKGGKGVSVAFGALFAVLGWQFAIGSLLLWIISLRIIRIMSLTNIILFTFLPFVTWTYIRSTSSIYFGIMITLLVLWAHRQNMIRLIEGKESRFRY